MQLEVTVMAWIELNQVFYTQTHKRSSNSSSGGKKELLNPMGKILTSFLFLFLLFPFLRVLIFENRTIRLNLVGLADEFYSVIWLVFSQFIAVAHSKLFLNHPNTKTNILCLNHFLCSVRFNFLWSHFYNLYPILGSILEVCMCVFLTSSSYFQ